MNNALKDYCHEVVIQRYDDRQTTEPQMQNIPTLITSDADVMNALHVSINRCGFFFNGDDHATKKKREGSAPQTSVVVS